MEFSYKNTFCSSILSISRWQVIVLVNSKNFGWIRGLVWFELVINKCFVFCGFYLLAGVLWLIIWRNTAWTDYKVDLVSVYGGLCVYYTCSIFLGSARWVVARSSRFMIWFCLCELTTKYVNRAKSVFVGTFKNMGKLPLPVKGILMNFSLIIFCQDEVWTALNKNLLR